MCKNSTVERKGDWSWVDSSSGSVPLSRRKSWEGLGVPHHQFSIGLPYGQHCGSSPKPGPNVSPDVARHMTSGTAARCMGWYFLGSVVRSLLDQTPEVVKTFLLKTYWTWTLDAIQQSYWIYIVAYAWHLFAPQCRGSRDCRLVRRVSCHEDHKPSHGFCRSSPAFPLVWCGLLVNPYTQQFS